jgi:hypothetical protein
MGCELVFRNFHILLPNESVNGKPLLDFTRTLLQKAREVSDRLRIRGIKAVDNYAAGAELIQDHSYSANRIKLAPYGLLDKASAINAQAVKLAREAKEEGIRISEELLEELTRRPEVSGAYIICPFNRYELALTILEAVTLPG